MAASSAKPLRWTGTRLERIDTALHTRKGRGRDWVTSQCPEGAVEGSEAWCGAAEQLLQLEPWRAPRKGAAAAEPAAGEVEGDGRDRVTVGVVTAAEVVGMFGECA